MQNHQAEAGVLPQVLDILDQNVDNQSAKEAADQIRSALAAIQNPTAPKV
jgi:archaellum component FlaG (FlaF/FlaG flagellin family)